MSLLLATPSDAETRQDAAGHDPLPCGLSAGHARTVTSVENAETLSLDTGDAVHLIGALAPLKPLTFTSVKNWRAERAALKALRSMVFNRSIVIASHGPPKTDRYGRIAAQLFVRTADGLMWVQRQLIASGHARAYAQDISPACFSVLLDTERQARSTNQGLWRDPYYQVYRLEDETAESTAALLKRRHRFQIVEGRIHDVAVVRTMIYFNFGTNWRTDFTAALTKSAAKASGASIDQLKALKGQRVQVRGWIERRNGPYIQLTGRHEIVPLDTAIGSRFITPRRSTTTD